MTTETFYRALSPRWSFAPLSGEGAALRGGRWNRAGTPAIYLAADVITAIVEYQQRTTFKPVLAVEYRLTNARLADIQDEDIRAMFGINDAIESNPWRLTAGQKQEPPSWPIADILQSKGYHGLLYRSQINGGACLVLWAWNAPMEPVLSVIDPDRRLPRDGRSWNTS